MNSGQNDEINLSTYWGEICLHADAPSIALNAEMSAVPHRIFRVGTTTCGSFFEDLAPFLPTRITNRTSIQRDAEVRGPREIYRVCAAPSESRRRANALRSKTCDGHNTRSHHGSKNRKGFLRHPLNAIEPIITEISRCEPLPADQPACSCQVGAHSLHFFLRCSP